MNDTVPMLEPHFDPWVAASMLCLFLALCACMILLGLINGKPDRPKDPHNFPPIFPPL